MGFGRSAFEFQSWSCHLRRTPRKTMPSSCSHHLGWDDLSKRFNSGRLNLLTMSIPNGFLLIGTEAAKTLFLLLGVPRFFERTEVWNVSLLPRLLSFAESSAWVVGGSELRHSNAKIRKSGRLADLKLCLVFTTGS